MSPETLLEEIQDIVNEQDAQYHEKWARESEVWAASHNAYDLALRALGDIPEGIHVDIGFGTGIFPFRVLQKFPERHVIGIDKSDAAFYVTAKFLQAMNVPLNGYNYSTYSLSGMNLSRQYGLDEEAAEQLSGQLVPGAISLIVDDIRFAEIVRHVLGDKKIASASFLFPGTWGFAAYEAPYAMGEIDDEECSRRIMAVMEQTRRAAYDFATEYVEDGGSFVVAERMFIDPEALKSPAHIRECIGMAIAGALGPRFRDWQHTESFMLHRDLSDMDSPLSWGRYDGKGELTENREGSRFFVHRLVRKRQNS